MSTYFIDELVDDTQRGVRVRDPFGLAWDVALPSDADRRNEWNWYFEQFFQNTRTDRVRASTAVAAIRDYGERLFASLFPPPALERFRTLSDRADAGLTFVATGSAEFHKVHWEALWDPAFDEPVCVRAQFARSLPSAGDAVPLRELVATPVEVSMLNVLMVIARPHADDVPLRAVARPMFSSLARGRLPARLDIVRPPTFAQLKASLEGATQAHGPGHFHVLHLDMHGVMPANSYSPPQLEFESESYGADPIAPAALAPVLLTHGITMIVLTACHSGKQVDSTRIDSFAAQLASFGIPVVIAMRYQALDTMAALFARHFYQRLAESGHALDALRDARSALFLDPHRTVGRQERVDVQDWMVPVAYMKWPQMFAFKCRRTPPSQRSPYVDRGAAAKHDLVLEEAQFQGRDLEIREIERLVLRVNNILLVRGLTGIGKSKLLVHLAAWWQRTGFVRRTINLGIPATSDVSAPGASSFFDDILAPLSTTLKFERRRTGNDPEPDGQLSFDDICIQMRQERHFLVLDQLDNLTDPKLRREITRLIRLLRGGQTIVLCGARGPQPWLAAGTFDDSVLELHGLAHEDYVTLLRLHGLTGVDPQAVQVGYRLAGGVPGVFWYMLSLAFRQAPLNADTERATRLPFDIPATPTPADDERSLDPAWLATAIDKAMNGLSDAEQVSLRALRPFCLALPVDVLPHYATLVEHHSGHRCSADFSEVLRRLESMGLAGHVDGRSSHVSLHPLLPTMLAARLTRGSALQRGIEAAFLNLYEDIAARTINEVSAFSSLPAALAAATREVSNLMQASGLAEREHRSSACYEGALSAIGLAAGQTLARPPATWSSLFPSPSREHEDTASPMIELRGVAMLLAQAASSGHAASTEQLMARLESILASATFTDSRVKGAVTQFIDAILLDSQGKSIAALQALDASLNTWLALDDRRMEALVRYAIGSQLIRREEWLAAWAHLESALQAATAYPEPVFQRDIHRQLGYTALGALRLEDAETHVARARELSRQLQDREGYAGALIDSGLVALARGDHQRAGDMFRSALANATHAVLVSSALSQLGRLANREHKWEEAEDNLRRAVEATAHMPDEPQVRADAYDWLTLSLLMQGKTDDATSACQQAEQAFLARERPEAAARCRKNVAYIRARPQGWRPRMQ